MRLGQAEDGVEPRELCGRLGVAMRIAECKVERLVAALDLVGETDGELLRAAAALGRRRREELHALLERLPLGLRRQRAVDGAKVVAIELLLVAHEDLKLQRPPTVRTTH